MIDDAVRAEFPVIETARLKLRKHGLDDLEACRAMWGDPNVTRYILGTPSSPQQTWARMLGYAGHWALMRFGYWAVEEKATGTFIGEIGFADFKRDIAASMQGSPELGWAFATHAHGRGIATEAARAAVAWGDAHFTSAKTVCLINPENLASLRVADKCGFAITERTTFGGTPIVFLARPRAII